LSNGQLKAIVDRIEKLEDDKAAIAGDIREVYAEAKANGFDTGDGAMIIGITGYAGSGKSTAAKHLVERHGFTLVKFAGPLKAMMRCLGLGDREIEGDLKEEPHPVLNYKTPRYAMQTLGTEWGRDLIGQNLWVDAAMASAATVIDQGGRVVIDDCRFPNEAAAIKEAGGVIIKVIRPLTTPVGAHASEEQELPVDWEVYNVNDVEGLGRVIDSTLDMMRRGRIAI
jgi:hypothetical protein